MTSTESPDVLRDALRRGLISLTEDSEVANLERASEALSDVFGDDRKQLQQAVHAVQDPASGLDDLVFTRAAEAIEQEWLTFRGKYPQGAGTLLRLTVIAAVERAVVGDDERSALVWYEAASSAEQYGSHDLSETWRAVVRRAGARTLDAAQRLWALTSASIEIEPIPKTKGVDPSTPKRPGDAWVTKQTAAAVKPTSKAGGAVAGANPYLPNSPQAWVDEFAERFGSFMVEYGSQFQLLIGEANTEMAASAQAAMSALTTAVRTATRTALKGVIESQHHLDRRSLLLWWSRTLHSTSLDISYRDLPPAVLPFVVALDAQKLVGPFAPLSVESLVREAVRAAECADGTVPELGEAVAEARDVLAALAAPYAVDLGGRVPLIRHLAAQAVGKDAGTWSDASADERSRDAGALAVWVYRSAQAHALVYNDA